MNQPYDTDKKSKELLTAEEIENLLAFLSGAPEVDGMSSEEFARKVELRLVDETDVAQKQALSGEVPTAEEVEALLKEVYGIE